LGATLDPSPQDFNGAKDGPPEARQQRDRNWGSKERRVARSRSRSAGIVEDSDDISQEIAKRMLRLLTRCDGSKNAA